MPRARAVAAGGLGLVVLSAVLVGWAGTRPGFDPYGWLVWGRQTLRWSLDTNGAPSWKPLPFLFTVPYAVLGRFALNAWMVTVVAISAGAPLLAGRIAYRLTGSDSHDRRPALVAAVVAGMAVLAIRGYPHYALSAQSDTVIVALCLGAIDSHLSGRPRIAFTLGVLASLGRPEAWPFLGLYALWAFRAIPRMRLLVLAGLALIPLLWFGIPAFTANSPFVAGNLALHSGRAVQGNKVYGVIDRFLDLTPWPLQAAALAAVVLAALRRDKLTLTAAAAAIGWVLIEIGFAFRGWPAIDRYMYEAAGLMAVLPGVVVGRALAACLQPRARGVAVVGGLAVVLLLGALAPALVSRARGERADLAKERLRARQIDNLQALITRLGGAARVLGCGTAVANIEFQSVAAWQLGTNVGRIGYHPGRLRRRRGPFVVFSPRKLGWRARTVRVRRACRGLDTVSPTRSRRARLERPPGV